MGNEYREALNDLLVKVPLEKTINSEFNKQVGKDKVKLMDACVKAKKYDEIINEEDSFEFHNSQMEYIEKLRTQWALDLIVEISKKSFLKNMKREDGSIKEYIIDKIRERYIK